MDWIRDDGINVLMLSDKIRNQFYKSILHFPNQECIEVGFGTGLLSVIALQNGAKHITAYEKDQSRYQLGNELISALSLGDRIKLRNEKFKGSDSSIAFHEVVGPNLFDEGIFTCLQNHHGRVVPGILGAEYFEATVDFSILSSLYTSDLPKQVYETLKGSDWPEFRPFPAWSSLPDAVLSEIWQSGYMGELTQFSTGIEGTELYEKFIQQKLSEYLKECISQLTWCGRSNLNKDQYRQFISDSRKIFEFSVDLTHKTITPESCANWEAGEASFSIPANPAPRIILPRFFLQEGEHKLILTDGHWDVPDLIFSVGQDTDVMINIDLHSGKMTVIQN